MKIVPIKHIPAKSVSVPQDSPAAVFQVCRQLEDLCRKHNGLGISAAQVGMDWRLFIVKDGERYRYFIDCEYEPVGDEKLPQIEGCLSLPGRLFRTNRWATAIVKGQELIVKDNEPTFVPFMEETSEIVFQHEIDHHRNILITDHGEELFTQPPQPPWR